MSCRTGTQEILDFKQHKGRETPNCQDSVYLPNGCLRIVKSCLQPLRNVGVLRYRNFTSTTHSPLCRLRYIIAKPLLQELFPATRRTFQCELADVTAKGRRGLIFSNECPCGSSKSTRDSERSFVPV